MNKFVCTWLCVDPAGEESQYSQMKLKGTSSSSGFLNVYWKNVAVFFFTCRKYNPDVKFLLFTNTTVPEKVEQLDFHRYLDSLGVSIVDVPFEYRTPKGYYSGWRNQFFEFSILEKISNISTDESDLYMLLDSDCVFTGDLSPLWLKAERKGYMTYKIAYSEKSLINGLTRIQMQEVYENLLGIKLDHPPSYFGGEFFLASANNCRILADEFASLWPKLLELNAQGKLKFNEEAHTLSYLYYINKFDDNDANEFVARLWTQPFIHRNVKAGDEGKLIWHLPHEKKYGILKLFKVLTGNIPKYFQMNHDSFHQLLSYYLTIPKIRTWIYVSRIIPIQLARFAYYTFKARR